MATNNYSLKYKQFSQLLDEVMIDFKRFTLENLIEPHELIKIAKLITYDLGLRIYQTNETVLEMCHGKVKLPEDFYIFNFGVLCGEFEKDVSIPQGTHIEEVPYNPGVPYRETAGFIGDCTNGVICSTCNLMVSEGCGCNKTCPTVPVPDYNPLVPYGDFCVKPRVFMNCKGQAFELIQIVNQEILRYKRLFPLKLVGNNPNVDCGCPNLHAKCGHEIWIKDGWLFSNFQHGKVYLNYQGMLQDGEGNLMVVDHDYLNAYYEYGLKERILENLWYGGEDVKHILDDVRMKLSSAKANAKKFVVTPNFEEIKDMWRNNRKAQLNKYFTMFEPMMDNIGYSTTTDISPSNYPLY